MTNATHTKYLHIYTINRFFNSEFDSWIKDNFVVSCGNEPWNFGQETFVARLTGEHIYSEAVVAKMYCDQKRPYFRTPSEVDYQYLAHTSL